MVEAADLGELHDVAHAGRLDCPRLGRILPPLLDLDQVSGPETAVEQIRGCPAGIDVRLLTMHGAPHSAVLRPSQ